MGADEAVVADRALQFAHAAHAHERIDADQAVEAVVQLGDPHIVGLGPTERGLLDTACEFAQLGESVCVPFNCYEGVLVIQEGDSEDTFYAPGVGGIKLAPKSGDPQETEELINLTQLSDQGLAELSAEAQKLDEHARTEASDVFGDSSPAEPTL